VLPAVVIGVGSALVLLVLSWASEQLQHWLWDWVPGRLGVSGDSRGWILLVLTATGVGVGLAVRLVPGHAGPDPATLALVDPPLPLITLPGIAVTAALGLAGGVSLGPENPITSINIALAFALGSRLLPRVPGAAWTALAAAGTIGALFGSPTAAALVLSERSAGQDQRPLWDRLFAPLVAAAAGAVTTVVVANPSFAVSLPPYTRVHAVDVLSAMVIATAGAIAGLVAVHAFPVAHRALHRLGRPPVVVACGGLLLGALGALGGDLTLFKGLDQIKDLCLHAGRHSAGQLLGLAVVKLAALVVAGSAGFRGGRIFPAVFVGGALGLCAHALVPAVPPALAVATAILGVLMATTQQGWLSLFTAATLVLSVELLPVLCIGALPAWLLSTGRPPMVIPAGRHRASEVRGAGAQP